MKPVTTARAPSPLGHYSQAIVYDGLVYVSGQLAIDPRTRQRHGETIEEQTEQVLRNISAILMAADTDINHVLKTTVYISDMDAWPKANEVYARFFGEHRPARSVVPIKDLPSGYLIEIDAVAAIIGRHP